MKYSFIQIFTINKRLRYFIANGQKCGLNNEIVQKSGPNGDRTHDLQIISLALYRLSYRTIRAVIRCLCPLIYVRHEVLQGPVERPNRQWLNRRTPRAPAQRLELQAIFGSMEQIIFTPTSLALLSDLSESVQLADDLSDA